MYVNKTIPIRVQIIAALMVVLFGINLTACRADQPEAVASVETGGQDHSYMTLGELDVYSMPSGLTDNLRRVIDLYSQFNESTDTGDESWQHIGGINVQKIFSNDGGDWGTLELQLYMIGLDGENPYPYTYEYDDHDESKWQLVTRNANFNYTGLAQGRFNVRVGHFEIPYGLEVPINTNGSLRQLISERNLYMKSDWGVSLNGVLPEFEYEVSLTRGSGNEYFHNGQPGVVSGRIGLPGDHLTLGLSAFAGKIYTHYGIQDRTRFGPDFQWQGGPFGFMGELSLGEDEKREVVNALLEANWTTPDEAWMLYVQNQMFRKRIATGWDKATVLIAGVQFTPNSTWALSTQYYQDLSTFGTTVRNGILSVQVRLTID